MAISPKVAAVLGISTCERQLRDLKDPIPAGIMLMGLRQAEKASREFDQGIADRLAALIQQVEEDGSTIRLPEFAEKIRRLGHDIDFSLTSA